MLGSGKFFVERTFLDHSALTLSLSSGDTVRVMVSLLGDEKIDV